MYSVVWKQSGTSLTELRSVMHLTLTVPIVTCMDVYLDAMMLSSSYTRLIIKYRNMCRPQRVRKDVVQGGKNTSSCHELKNIKNINKASHDSLRSNYSSISSD